MNLSGLLSIFDQLPAFGQFIQELESQQSLPALGLPRSARAPFLARLSQARQVPILLITSRVDTVSNWQQTLEAWLPEGREVLRFLEPTPLPYDRGPWSDRSRFGRLQVLSRLMAGQHPQLPPNPRPPLIVTSPRALLQKTLPKRRFLSATRVLRAGQIVDLEKMLEGWLAVGYEGVSVVETAGQFCRRGGILDIFPAASPFPVRIELFGDEIDTLRYFDPATQRSLETHLPDGRLLIPPAHEALPMAAQEYATCLQDEPLPLSGSLPSWRDDIADLIAGNTFPHIEYYLPLIYPQPASLLEYLPENALVVVNDWQELETAVTELHAHADQMANEQPGLPPDYSNPLFAWETFSAELQWWQPLILGEGPNPLTPQHPLAHLADSFEPGPRYGGQMRPLMTQLRQSGQEKERMLVVSIQAARLAELWAEEQRSIQDSLLTAPPGNAPTHLVTTLPPESSLTFVQGSLAEGFTLVRREDDEILLDLLTDAEVFGWSRPAPRRFRASRPAAPETHFADIAAGDYVVHLEYGIGRFQGLVSRTIGGMEREYLLVEYANNDVLYVPVHHADRLSKWIGSNDNPPALQRLGERGWTATKVQAQKAADDLASELLELYSAREMIAGHAYGPDTQWQSELEASFPYQETEDQLRVIAEVKLDMERPYPMDRLICGDVGYGKTEVALRAAFKAVSDDKQVAILVPTTILAQQHYNTFTERLSPFPVTVEMLSRFRTPMQQEKTIKNLREGKADIIIGTHRLLSEDVSFKDLGLVIIDEEQRFGVAHKERLKQWRTEVDVLTMTATPIPRTLYMSMTGVRDVSIIDTAPADRLPVQTYVGDMDEARLKRAILRELDRGGQVFFVHNRVQTIQILLKQLETIVPEARIAKAHGQMSERELERVMIQFADGDIDILLATTIIESGLDFPNANTLIVDRAERFGLAQLYQLRGRVGRGARRAYAYFFHSAWKSLNADAQQRLEAIAAHSDLGAGYTIAVRDMEIRGAGDLLGANQSGHISAVGFDLYTRLLSNAVKRRKAEKEGKPLPADLPEAVLIDIPLATYVPTDYVPDAGLRLRLYRRMAALETLEEIDEMATELADRFGAIPDPVHNLLYQLRIKSLAQRAFVTAVTTEAGQIKVRVAEMDDVERTRMQRYLGPKVRVSKKAIWLSKEMGTHEWQVVLVQILEKLQLFERNKPKE